MFWLSSRSCLLAHFNSTFLYYSYSIFKAAQNYYGLPLSQLKWNLYSGSDSHVIVFQPIIPSVLKRWSDLSSLSDPRSVLVFPASSHHLVTLSNHRSWCFLISTIISTTSTMSLMCLFLILSFLETATHIPLLLDVALTSTLSYRTCSWVSLVLLYHRGPTLTTLHFIQLSRILRAPSASINSCSALQTSEYLSFSILLIVWPLKWTSLSWMPSPYFGPMYMKFSLG